MPKRLGVLTSGGDAQGMNAAIRSILRAALDQGAEVYGIYEGYQGMIDGGKYIRQVDWAASGGILHKGGTIFGTARSPEFHTRDGRRKAVGNLLRHGIDQLVVIGGDGSLTGANILRQEWKALGHLQQGGDPTPYDRILATRLAASAIDFMETHYKKGDKDESAAAIGLLSGNIEFTPLYEIPRLMDDKTQRPKEQWWMELRPIAKLLAQPGPGFNAERVESSA